MLTGPRGGGERPSDGGSGHSTAANEGLLPFVRPLGAPVRRAKLCVRYMREARAIGMCRRRGPSRILPTGRPERSVGEKLGQGPEGRHSPRRRSDRDVSCPRGWRPLDLVSAEEGATFRCEGRAHLDSGLEGVDGPLVNLPCAGTFQKGAGKFQEKRLKGFLPIFQERVGSCSSTRNEEVRADSVRTISRRWSTSGTAEETSRLRASMTAAS